MEKHLTTCGKRALRTVFRKRTYQWITHQCKDYKDPRPWLAYQRLLSQHDKEACADVPANSRLTAIVKHWVHACKDNIHHVQEACEPMVQFIENVLGEWSQAAFADKWLIPWESHLLKADLTTNWDVKTDFSEADDVPAHVEAIPIPAQPMRDMASRPSSCSPPVSVQQQVPNSHSIQVTSLLCSCACCRCEQTPLCWCLICSPWQIARMYWHRHQDQAYFSRESVICIMLHGSAQW